jgi:predicted RNase H-like HicB family nuclease
LHTDDGIHYGVSVPDLPGCTSAGDGVDEALASVVEAIHLHLEGMVEDGEAVPEPQSVAVHRTQPDFADGVWALVDVDVTRYEGKAEKINITVPRRLLARIDDYTKAHHVTRSGFLADAARRAMR